VDYWDERHLGLHHALLQERHSLPQPGTIAPIFRDETRMPGEGDAQNVMLVMVEIFIRQNQGPLLCGRLDGYRH
jgi:hypothetical protein